MHSTMPSRATSSAWDAARTAEYYAYLRGDIPIADLRAAYPCEWEQVQRGRHLGTGPGEGGPESC